MKKGFTLIELIVVVAILGIITSVVLASYNSAKEKCDIDGVCNTEHEVKSKS